MFILGLIGIKHINKSRKVKFQIFKITNVCTKIWSVTGWPIISNISLQKQNWFYTHQSLKISLCAIKMKDIQKVVSSQKKRLNDKKLIIIDGILTVLEF